LKISCFGNFKSQIKILNTAISSDKNLLLSVGKLQLFVSFQALRVPTMTDVFRQISLATRPALQ